ncbi:MAG TPA: hypothetical protein VFF73_15600, partial [Planctomycetota bacterium]|nr:hypothetical protein [Planctomycetota bacterium]
DARRIASLPERFAGREIPRDPRLALIGARLHAWALERGRADVLVFASRLAPPPADRKQEVLALLAGELDKRAVPFVDFSRYDFSSTDTVRAGHDVLALLELARAVDPGASDELAWKVGFAFHEWAQSLGDSALVTAQQIFDAWPEHPVCLYWRARIAALENGPSALALALRAIDRFPGPGNADRDLAQRVIAGDLAQLVYEIGFSIFETDPEERAPGREVITRAVAAAERGAQETTFPTWFGVASLALLADDEVTARRAAEGARRSPASPGTGRDAAVEKVLLDVAAGNVERAELRRVFGRAVGRIVRALEARRLWVEIAELARPRATRSPEERPIWLATVRALVKVGRTEDAKAYADAVEAVDPTFRAFAHSRLGSPW